VIPFILSVVANYTDRRRGLEGLPVPTQIVTYDVDDSTSVQFEIEPAQGFRPAGPGQVLGRVRDAVSPAIEAAKAVLDKAKEAQPDQVEVTFGVKVSGAANWLVARSAGEGSFAITLRWTHQPADRDAGGE
jgi:hypothetical protein